MKEDILTPFEAELIVMIESVTGETPAVRKTETKPLEIYIPCDKMAQDVINSLMDAIKGRLGERLISCVDYTEFIRVVAENDSIKIIRLGDGWKDIAPVTEAGMLYQRRTNPIRAVQVTRGNAETLCRFVGGGEMRIEKKVDGKCWFTFLNNGVFITAEEDDFVVKRPEIGHFEVIKEKQFNKDWVCL